MSSTTSSRTRRVLVAAAATVAVAASVVAAGPATADARSAQDAYLAFLQAKHDTSGPYTAMDDYVRVLEFWQDHPDWTAGD